MHSPIFRADLLSPQIAVTAPTPKLLLHSPCDLVIISLLLARMCFLCFQTDGSHWVPDQVDGAREVTVLHSIHGNIAGMH